MPLVTPTAIDGLSAIADRYDAFLIDQYGVMHDGHQAYPGAIECFAQLKQNRKIVVMLTNSGRRAEGNAARVKRLGFPPDLYTAVVSSGEVAHTLLAERTEDFFASLGQRCVVVSTAGERSMLDGLAIEVVDTLADADFLIVAGWDEDKDEQFYERLIEDGLARGLPLICANPDETRITPAGLRPGTGMIAKQYQQRGGSVYYVGKPYPAIYEFARRHFPQVAVDRVLVIGDSLAHDIAGGAGVGFAGALIAGGIHRDSLQDLSDADALAHRLQDLAGANQPLPQWVMPTLQW